jgi:hypothetical protein
MKKITFMHTPNEQAYRQQIVREWQPSNRCIPRMLGRKRFQYRSHWR